jgi:DoxX-like family
VIDDGAADKDPTPGACCMVAAYWIVAALLAVFYLYAGGIKVVRSKDRLRPMMGWIDAVPLPLTRAIGVLEVLGALGLVLPPLTGVAPGLALAAAVGLVLVQLGGIALHLSRGEARLIGLNVVLLVLALAAVWLATTWV